MDSLIAFARAGAKGPKEIVLPTRDFLWLAGDLGLDDGRSPLRYVLDPRPVPSFAEPSPKAETFKTKTVRVPDSFVFNGPCGPVTIREAKE